MNRFDYGILLWLNSFAHRSHLFDSAIVFLSGSDLFKGQLFVLILCWYWFLPGPNRPRNREIVLATVAAAFVAIFAGRLLAAVLPFRLRPAFNPELALAPIEGTDLRLRLWSAFPSDHAMLFAALATGLCLISPAVGAAAYAYALLVIDFPRVYLGLHHPTDVLAGVALGTAASLALNRDRVRGRVAEAPLRLMREHESAFYTAFTFLAIEIMTMFSEPRNIAGIIVHHLKGGR